MKWKEGRRGGNVEDRRGKKDEANIKVARRPYAPIEAKKPPVSVTAEDGTVLVGRSIDDIAKIHKKREEEREKRLSQRVLDATPIRKGVK